VIVQKLDHGHSVERGTADAANEKRSECISERRDRLQRCGGGHGDPDFGSGGERSREDLGKDEIIHCDEIVYMSRTHSQGEVSTRSDREMVSLSLGGASSSHQARLSTHDDASGIR
jgi:hypothetical protein